MINNYMHKNLKSLDSFVREANKKFASKFDYSQSIYLGASKPINIICPNHGVYTTTPTTHLSKKHGCKKCAIEIMAQLQKDKTKKNFLEYCKSKNEYDFSLVKFDLITEKIDIICREHGIFSITVDHFLRGSGCKKCADKIKTGGYSNKWFSYNEARKELPGILYVLEMYNESEKFIKLGITKNSVKQRYYGNKYQYKILATFYDSLYNCFLIERSLKTQFRKYRYENKHLFGLTESFSLNQKDNIMAYIQEMRH